MDAKQLQKLQNIESYLYDYITALVCEVEGMITIHDTKYASLPTTDLPFYCNMIPTGTLLEFCSTMYNIFCPQTPAVLFMTYVYLAQVLASNETMEFMVEPIVFRRGTIHAIMTTLFFLASKQACDRYYDAALWSEAVLLSAIHTFFPASSIHTSIHTSFLRHTFFDRSNGKKEPWQSLNGLSSIA